MAAADADAVDDLIFFVIHFFRHCGIARVSQLLMAAAELKVTRTHTNETDEPKTLGERERER